MTLDIWMCLLLLVLLVGVFIQNMGLRDSLRQLESQLDSMAESLRGDRPGRNKAN